MDSQKDIQQEASGEETTDKINKTAGENQAKEENGGEEPAARLEQLEKEKEELYQRYLRARADFENYRRRMQEELWRVRRGAVEDFILKILPVLDNLERATASSGEEKSLRTGVEMVLRQFMGILKEEEVTPITAVGEVFDPRKHEAFSREESEQPENTVLEEVQKGYLIGEKTLRPSLVKVAAGNRRQWAAEKKQQEMTGEISPG